MNILKRIKAPRPAKMTPGRLRSCSYESRSNGMMANSDAFWTAEIIREDVQKKKCVSLTVRKKEALASAHEKKVRLTEDAFLQIEAFVQRENLAALSKLKQQRPLFQVMDYSSSETIRLVFDETENGKVVSESIWLDVAALRQNDLGHLADTLQKMLADAAQKS